MIIFPQFFVSPIDPPPTPGQNPQQPIHNPVRDGPIPRIIADILLTFLTTKLGDLAGEDAKTLVRRFIGV